MKQASVNANEIVMGKKYYKQYRYHCNKNTCVTCKFNDESVYGNVVNTSRDVCFKLFLLRHNLVEFTYKDYFLKISDEEVKYIINEDKYKYNNNDTVDVYLTKAQIVDANKSLLKEITEEKDPYITDIATIIIKRRATKSAQGIKDMKTAERITKENFKVNLEGARANEVSKQEEDKHCTVN